MPRRKTRPPKRQQGIRLQEPGPKTSLENNDLVDHLLRGPVPLDGAACFESEEEERRAWLENKELIMRLAKEGERLYYAGGYHDLPWAYHKYKKEDRQAEPGRDPT